MARIGVVGCGVVAGMYVPRLQTLADTEVVALADAVPDRAHEAAARFGVPKVLEVDDLLASPDVDIVLNLTVPSAHAVVGRAVIDAGKHLYNEKPLALERAEGADLLAAAAARGVRVGCAPDTFLGAGIQTARHLLDEGEIGTPVAATAFFMGHGPEGWHPRPEFFYERGGGPMLDVGVYSLTTLVILLGPVARVTASSRISFPERTVTAPGRDGERIPVTVPTHVAGNLEFASGAVATLIASFDVWGHRLPYIEVYGSDGSMSLPNPNLFGGPVSLLRPGGEWTTMPEKHAFTEPRNRGVGVAEMAKAIADGRPHRASGELALHVLDLIESMEESAVRGGHVETSTTCDRPAALPPGLPEGRFD